MSACDDSEDLLQQVELMWCKVVEIAAPRNVWLQTPGQIGSILIVKVAWRHREAYLHIGNSAKLS